MSGETLTFDRVSNTPWSRTLSRDPATGTETIYHWRPDGRIVIQKKQRVDHITEMNKALFNATDERAGWGNQLARTVAQLPVSVYWDLKKRGVIDDPARFKKWLNDRDNRAFRTRPGRV